MRPRSVAVLALLLAGVVGCGDAEPGRPAGPAGSATATATATATGAGTQPAPAPPPTRAPAEPRAGIDASHHQGPIDWTRVARHGIEFAYLKATEGTGFADPRFADHRLAAQRAGIDVGAYHYFQLCSDGGDQARHLLATLGPSRADGAGPAGGDLPPAVDLELLGSCAQPPERDVLLAEVREFLAVVERRLRVRGVVYLYPDFEQRYRFAADLAGHPQWVRRLGTRPPLRDWQIWQYDDAGTVPGIAGGVDLNRARPIG